MPPHVPAKEKRTLFSLLKKNIAISLGKRDLSIANDFSTDQYIAERDFKPLFVSKLHLVASVGQKMCPDPRSKKAPNWFYNVIPVN